MADVCVIGDGRPDGCTVGANATEKVSLFGVAPVVQPTTIAAVATTGSTNSTPYGFTTAAQADALVANVNSILSKLKDLGIIAV